MSLTSPGSLTNLVKPTKTNESIICCPEWYRMLGGDECCRVVDKQEKRSISTPERGFFLLSRFSDHLRRPERRYLRSFPYKKKRSCSSASGHYWLSKQPLLP